MLVFRNLGPFQNLLSSILNVSSPQNEILVHFCFNNFNLVIPLELRRAVPSSILRSSFMYVKTSILAAPSCLIYITWFVFSETFQEQVLYVFYFSVNLDFSLEVLLYFLTKTT